MRGDIHTHNRTTTTTKEKRVKPTEQDTKTPPTATGLFALLHGLLHFKGSGAPNAGRGSGPSSPTPFFMMIAAISATLLASAGLAAALPAAAGAYATPAPENVYSSAPGLPDGRVYEQVSPADKNGNEAGRR